VAAALAASKLLWAPFFAWNDTRLAPSAALLGGYGLYSPPGEGPLLGHMYGPIGPLVYLPAVFMPSPEAAIFLGAAIASLCFFGPAYLLLALEDNAPRRWVWLVFLVFFLYSSQKAGLGGVAFGIHVDAPALGLGALSCAALCARRRHRWLEWGSALALVLAVGCKQVALPLAAALPCFLLVAEGRSSALAYAAKLGVVGVLVLAGLGLFVNFEGMWFHAVTAPLVHPWKPPGGIAGLLLGFRELFLHGWPIAVVAGLCFGLAGRGRAGRAGIRGESWLLLVIVALFFIPSSVLGWVKVGGAANSMAYSLYFFALAAAVLFLRVLGDAKNAAGYWAKVGLLVLGALLVVSQWATLEALPSRFAALDENPARKAWAFAKEHPGSGYFPFHPLINLMAEGRADHSTSGLMIQDLTGERVGAEHLRAHLPPGMRVIAFPGARDYSEAYFPEYTHRAPFAEIPGWTRLSRPAAPDGLPD